MSLFHRVSCRIGNTRNAHKGIKLLLERAVIVISLETSLRSNRNYSRLLRNDYNYRVAYLRKTYRGSVTGTEILVYVVLGRKGQEAARRADTPVANYYRSVVQGRLVKENITENIGRNRRVYINARLYKVAKLG